MKHILLSLLVLTSSPLAFSSDKFTNEIVCERLSPRFGMQVIIQSNPTAWVKRVAIIDNRGFAGPEEIGHFQIPLVPQIQYSPQLGWTHTYKTNGFVIQLKVSSSDRDQYQVLGPAAGGFTLETESYKGPFNCKLARRF